MFFHNFKYTIKTLFKNRMLIFWTYAFPIILGTLFSFAFSNIEKSEKLNIIDIAIVENDEFNNDNILKETFSTLGKENGEDQLFNITYTTEENSIDLLSKDKISGYLVTTNETPKIVIKQNGIDQTILKYVVEEIIQTKQVISDIASTTIKNELQNGNYNIDYTKIYEDIITKVNNQKANIVNTSNANLSYTMIEYYTLIALACLYGATLGMFSVNKVLANMSNNGKRVAISPIRKVNLLCSSILASYVVQLIGIAILFAFAIFVIQVDFGTKILPIILLALVGSLAGLTLGIAVATLFKAGENAKTGIIISFTMLGCFFSGMMGITMKYIIDTSVPIINKINPANMITDGFYSLYYYSTMDRFWFNIISLLIFSFIMIALSFIVLRRQKYDSI